MHLKGGKDFANNQESLESMSSPATNKVVVDQDQKSKSDKDKKKSDKYMVL